jgi:hypothetical protein
MSGETMSHPWPILNSKALDRVMHPFSGKSPLWKECGVDIFRRQP